jgi:DNA (cytosine-5)-methyltransferase 1
MHVTSGSKKISSFDNGSGRPIANHIARKVGVDVQRRIDALKIGQKMQDLPEELWHDSFRFYVKEDPTRKGGPNLRLIRLDPLAPSLTVTAYIFNKFVHPFENRFISVREAARLQGFPDDLVFHGSLTATQQQVGNAVPVPLAQAVFRELTGHAKRYHDTPHLEALSLFSGAGGMDIGAATNDVNIKVALEIMPEACETLRNYFTTDCAVIQRDVSAVENVHEFWREHSDKPRPDLIFGGPPCQAFSQAGKQKGFDDDRGQMIAEFLRFVSILLPAYFVMENVANLRGVQNGRLYDGIISEMRSLGYNVSVHLLTATDYGTPQRRRRLFFVGCRIANAPMMSAPEATHGELSGLFGLAPYATVGEAFRDLPSATYTQNA